MESYPWEHRFSCGRDFISTIIICETFKLHNQNLIQKKTRIIIRIVMHKFITSIDCDRNQIFTLCAFSAWVIIADHQWIILNKSPYFWYHDIWIQKKVNAQNYLHLHCLTCFISFPPRTFSLELQLEQCPPCLRHSNSKKFFNRSRMFHTWVVTWQQNSESNSKSHWARVLIPPKMCKEPHLSSKSENHLRNSKSQGIWFHEVIKVLLRFTIDWDYIDGSQNIIESMWQSLW